MSPFEFVSVFFTVVLGLAVTHLMQGIGDLLEVRNRVRGYWVQSMWLLTVLLVQTQAWWGLWDLRTARIWSFASYFMVVLYLASIYLLTTLLLPNVGEAESVIDLRAHYYRVHRVFFLVMGASGTLAVLLNTVLFGTPLWAVLNVVPATFVLVSALGVRSSHPRLHGAIAVFFLVAFSFFLVMDGLQIQ